MKVKITFIAETSKWNTFEDLKSDRTKIKSCKKYEKAFAAEINRVLQLYLVEDEETEKVYDVKAKILDRKKTDEM